MTVPTLFPSPSELLRQRVWERFRAGAAPVVTAGPAPAGDWLYRVRNGDNTAQREYIDRYWAVVEREATRYARRGGPHEDLRGEGALALWEAVFLFNPARIRIPLDRYVANHIHQRVRRAYVRAMGYGDRSRVIPLSDVAVNDASTEDEAIGAAEQLYDVLKAAREMAGADRAVIEAALDREYRGLGSEPRGARERKHLQRARRRLQDRLRR